MYDRPASVREALLSNQSKTRAPSQVTVGPYPRFAFSAKNVINNMLYISSISIVVCTVVAWFISNLK